MTADPQVRALAAARAVAAAHGLPTAEATVVHAGSNVHVHLRPAPVVARVMTGTVALHDDPRAWLEREVAVLRFLAPSGVAVAPPADVPPGPHRAGGTWLTLSTWIPDVQGAPTPDEAAAVGHALRTLHDALAPFDGALGDAAALRDDILRLHALLRPADDADAAAIAALRDRLEALDRDVFASALPVQALHGDVSLGNLLRTPRGLVWNDFEDVLRGPAHWDVASLTASLRGRGGDEAAVRHALEAYGWSAPAALEPFLAAHAVYDEIWRRYDRQRRGGGPRGG